MRVRNPSRHACREMSEKAYLGTDTGEAIFKVAMYLGGCKPFIIVTEVMFSQLALHGLASKEAIESIRQG